jgi:hypothetical protein
MRRQNKIKILLLTGFLFMLAYSKAQTYYNFSGGNPADAVFTIYISGEELKPGDEIAAFDGEKLVGAMVVSSNNPFENNLAVFSTLNEGDGYQPGNPIKLNAWVAEEEREIVNVKFIFQPISQNAYLGTVYPEGDGVFSLAEITLEPNSVQEFLKPEIRLFPNPATDVFFLESDIDLNKVQVFNMVGQLVGFYEIDSRTMTFDLNGIESGVYFVKLHAKEFELTKRLIIR